MTPFNVEIFDQSLALRHHTNVNAAPYSEDYLVPKASTVSVPYSPDISKGDYIRIYRDDLDYFGRIKSVTDEKRNNTLLTVEYEPFTSLFSNEVLFDTALQSGTQSLEQTIAQIITANWISNSDVRQNVPGLRVVTTSATTGWTFYLTPSSKTTTRTILNLYDQIIVPALTKYKVSLYVVPDFTARTITVRIGAVSEAPYYIEADLPSVIVKNIVLGETSEDVNKLIVYNNDDLQTTIIYYKHPDRSYDTSDTDRITPVIYSIATVTPSEDEPFIDGAKLAADRQFDQASYNNLIELTILGDDPLIRPEQLRIGREVYIISEGVIYTSMLTGREVGQTTKLIFGTIRLDLTTLIKERFKNGS